MVEFRRRIVDNTLPQSAVHFVRGFGKFNLDPAAPIAFATFVDAYINAPIRCATLPGSQRGIGDEFTSLWQLNATETSHGTGRMADAVDEENLLRSFAASLVTYPDAWTGWLCFQFTSTIGEQYRSRVLDWRERLGRATAEVRRATSTLSLMSDARVTPFRDKVLAPAISSLATRGSPEGGLDDEYRSYAARMAIEISLLALAYGWDWYRRGYLYCRHVDDVWVAFHPLRSDVGLVAARAPAEEITSRPEVRWSRILTAYLDRQILAADPLVVVDILQALQHSIAARKVGFAEQMEASAASEDPVDRQERYREAVVNVLMHADLRPVLRRTARRSDLLEAAGKAITGGADLASVGLVGPLVGEVIRMSMGSRRPVRMEYEFRRRFRHRSLWRSFEVPGLTS